MPKQINTYTFGAGLVRKFGLKGRYQPVLDEVIVPVSVVDEALVARPAAGGAIATAAGAGNQNRIFMWNPVGSGIVCRIEKWWAVSGAPLTDFVQIIPPGDAAGSPAGWRVHRDGQYRGLAVCGFSTVASASAVLGGPQYHLDTDSIQWVEEWILRPGQRMEWRQNAANTTLDVWVIWTETDETATNA